MQSKGNMCSYSKLPNDISDLRWNRVHNVRLGERDEKPVTKLSKLDSSNRHKIDGDVDC
jgi:hypothetical protein